MFFGVIFFLNLVYSFFRCYTAETEEDYYKAFEYTLISIPSILVVGIIITTIINL